MPCETDRPLTQADREAGFRQQRTGVPMAVRRYLGPIPPGMGPLIDYLNREVIPAVQRTRDAVNEVYLPVVDNSPSSNPLGYYFSTETANADPTAGRLRLNASPQETATVIRVSQDNGRLQDVAVFLDIMSGSATVPLGVVTLVDSINPGRYIRFDLTAIADQGAYWNLTVTPSESSHTDPFVDGEAVVLAFMPGVGSTPATVPISVIAPALAGAAGDGLVWDAINLEYDVVGSTSIIVGLDSVNRAALTGAIAAAQNSNATVFSGIRDNGSAENDRTNLNHLTTTSIVAVVTDDAGNDELEITHERAALTGAIAATQNSNATLFAGIRDNGSAENDRTNLNVLSTTSIVATVTDDSGNDELEITHQRAALTGLIDAAQNSNATTSAEPFVTYSPSANMSAERVTTSSTTVTVSTGVASQIEFQRAALTGAIAATANSNATLFSGIRDNGSAENDRTNLNLVSSTSCTAVVTDDAGNDELEITFQRAALTGEVTASADSNATTVVRSTNFDTAPWTGPHQFDDELTINDQLRLDAVYADTDFSDADGVVVTPGDVVVLDLTSSATGDPPHFLDSIVPPTAGQRCLFLLYNSATTVARDILIRHQQTTGTTAANRIICPNQQSYYLQAGGGCWIYYDATVSRWRVIGAVNVPPGITEPSGTDARAYVRGTSSLSAWVTQASLAAIFPASDTAGGLVELATAAETATATDSTRAVTPAALTSHNGIVKCWGSWAGNTATLDDDYNISSIVDSTNGTTVNINTDFGTANWTPLITCEQNTSNTVGNSYVGCVGVASKLAGQIIIRTFSLSGGVGPPALAPVAGDPGRTFFLGIGDQ